LAKPPFEGKIKKNGYVKTNKIWRNICQGWKRMIPGYTNTSRLNEIQVQKNVLHI
jgi:hypothetical protein